MRKFKTEYQKVLLRRPNQLLTPEAQLTLPGFEINITHLLTPTKYKVNYHRQTLINS